LTSEIVEEVKEASSRSWRSSNNASAEYVLGDLAKTR
jgi:hypothetical protein